VSSEAPAERKTTPFGRIALVFVVLFVVGVVIVMLMHRTFVAAERVAARHVPADAVAVVRVDLEKATLFAPVRRFLLPLLDGESSAPGQARWERVAARSELVVGRDTREALALWGPGGDDWAVVLGGNYPSGVLPAVGEVLSEEGTPWRREGERLVAPSGRAFAQAADHALLLASDAARLQKALPASNAHERLGIPQKGAFAFAADPSKLPWLAQALAPLSDVRRVTAAADWSSPLLVHLELTLGDAPPAGAAQLVRDRFKALVGQQEASRLERVVGPPEVTTQGSVLRVTTRWDHEALERLAERLAHALQPQRASR
jgi:hypothetical protein